MDTKTINIDDKRIKLIAKKIKKLRILKGYSSYEDFALDFNLDRKQYWRDEKGSNITLKTLFKILDIHKISLDEFFSGIEFQ